MVTFINSLQQCLKIAVIIVKSSIAESSLPAFFVQSLPYLTSMAYTMSVSFKS